MKASSSKSILSEVDDLLLEAACATDTDAKSEALTKARAILGNALIDRPNDADLYLADRLELNSGWWARGLTPVLTTQLKPRLGFGTDQLEPISNIGRISAPKLIMARTRDRHTPLAESPALFTAATEPKEFWAVEGRSPGSVRLHAS